MKILVFLQILCLVNIINGVQGDDGDDGILTSEGSPGWIESLLKEAKKEQDEERVVREQSGESPLNLAEVSEDSNPPLAMTKLDDAFNKLGSEASSAKTGLAGLKSKWTSLPFGDRNGLMGAMNVAASQIGKFANAGDDPVGAVQAAITMVGSLAVAAGPMGMIANVALNFVSGLLSLFGAGGKKQKSVGEIVREQIDEALDEFADRTLMQEAEGMMGMFDVSKSYVDSLVKHKRKLTVNEANMIATSVPLWQGLKFMGKLSSIILNLVKENKVDSSRKLLKYIEVYANVAVLKDMILMETAMLMPDDLRIHGSAMLVVQRKLRKKQKNWFKFLFQHDPEKTAIHYYDPEKYPITDTYLISILKIPNYDRSLAGTWCITPHISGKALTPLSWSYGSPTGILYTPFKTIMDAHLINIVVSTCHLTYIKEKPDWSLKLMIQYFGKFMAVTRKYFEVPGDVDVTVQQRLVGVTWRLGLNMNQETSVGGLGLGRLS